MWTQNRLRSMAVGTFVGAALFAAGPVSAAPKHQGSCLRYSYSVDRWVNVCRSYSNRDAGPRLLPPHPFYYPFHYEPPYATNGPYYGYEPYNGYQSALGIWF